MVTARLGQMVTLSPRRLAEQPLRRRRRSDGRLGGEVRPRRLTLAQTPSLARACTGSVRDIIMMVSKPLWPRLVR
jgi:hypothetical protein